MKDIVYSIALFMALWGGAFTLLFLGSGTTELALKENIEAYRSHSNSYKRTLGHVLWIFFDKLNRWFVSLIGFVILFLLKIG